MYKKIIIIGALLASASAAQAGELSNLKRSLQVAAASSRYATTQCDAPRFNAIVYTRPGSAFFNVLFKSLHHQENYKKAAQTVRSRIAHTKQQLAHASGKRAKQLKKQLHQQNQKHRDLRNQEIAFSALSRQVVNQQTILIHNFKALC